MSRHSTDMVSLIAGGIFLAVVGMWLLDRLDVLAGLRDWLLPIVLIVAGLIGLIGIRPRQSSGHESNEADPADPNGLDDPAVAP